MVGKVWVDHYYSGRDKNRLRLHMHALYLMLISQIQEVLDYRI